MLVEVYKSLNNIGNKLGWNKYEIIQQNNNNTEDSQKGPQLRRGPQIKLPLPKNTFCLNSFNFRAGQAWNRLPIQRKTADTVENFTNKITKTKIYCSCKLCSIF